MRRTIDDFSVCHAGIIGQLLRLKNLPNLLDQPDVAGALARDMLHFFRVAVVEHHAEEEWDLFRIAVDEAQSGKESEAVNSMVDRLTQEHRQLEFKWGHLEPVLAQIERGETTDLDADAVDDLVLDYCEHADFEEKAFLPLCQTIFSRTRAHVTAHDLSHHVPRESLVTAF